jgi:hypothetical protein
LDGKFFQFKFRVFPPTFQISSPRHTGCTVPRANFKSSKQQTWFRLPASLPSLLLFPKS